MVSEQEIVRVATQVGRAADAERVLLFGSHARNEAKEHSDVDLMVIAASDLPRHKRSRQLYKSIRPYTIGLDLVVYTPQEIERDSRAPLSFVSNVLREGKEVYVR